MAKRAMSFKPTSECEVQLAELMDRWSCDRTAALIRAVSIAHGSETPDYMKDPDEWRLVEGGPKVDPVKPVVTESFTDAAPSELKKVEHALKQAYAKPLTPEERQKKADAFYRDNMAKGKK